MASTDAMFIPKKNAAYRLTFVVRDTSDNLNGLWTVDSGLASGGSKARLTKDGGAAANSTNNVQLLDLGFGYVDLTATEMNCDTLTVGIFIPTSGVADQGFVLNPETRVIDDLAYPAVSGRSLAVDASGQVDVRTLAAGSFTSAAWAANAITAAAITDGAFTNPKFADSFLTAAKIATDAIGSDELAASAILEIVLGVWAQTMTEPASVPAVNATLKAALEWMFILSRNKRTQTATTEILRNDADNATVGTSVKADDGTTFTRGEFA